MQSAKCRIAVSVCALRLYVQISCARLCVCIAGLHLFLPGGIGCREVIQLRYPAQRPKAVACISGGREHPGISGTVSFYPRNRSVLIVAEICGLPENDSGFFAFHIHEGGSCTGEGFRDTGGHFDPGGQPYPRHAGDLPPLLSRRGRAFLAVETDRFSIGEILGRTVVIHGGADDFHTQPAGNAGEKIACGVIQKW